MFDRLPNLDGSRLLLYRGSNLHDPHSSDRANLWFDAIGDLKFRRIVISVKVFAPIRGTKGLLMQYGVLDRVTRRQGSDVWTYRWREPGPSGKFIYRRRVIGTVKQFRNKVAARNATVGLVREINSQDLRVKSTTMTFAQLAQHYRQRELRPENKDKNYSTKAGYNCYLKKWIVPRWGEPLLPSIRASEVEEWLKYLELAAATRNKICNLMSVVFDHAIRHDLYDRNPITSVRQSAKRQVTPCVLGSTDIQAILACLLSKSRSFH